MTLAASKFASIGSQTFDARARVAIDLGAESCRVSLLRWENGRPSIRLIYRKPNGPSSRGPALFWQLEEIMSGVEQGLSEAAAAAPEGIASIAADGWAVDYVRLDNSARPIGNPYCYRDERTVESKLEADKIASADWLFKKAGAQPLRINTLYQLLADHAAGVDPHAPWFNLPEYILHRLGGRAVSEYTNATHTGMVDLETGDWSQAVMGKFDLCPDSFPTIVHAGTVVGKLQGPLANLDAFRNTQLIVPACHDTASAIAGIATEMKNTAYLCSGTWSLLGTLLESPIASREALEAGFTNLGAAGGGFCFHANVNGMWILKQCIEGWSKAGRVWDVTELVLRAEECASIPGTIPVSAPSLLLPGNMPARLNEQLAAAGYQAIPDTPGNEPLFARLIFESLAQQYAVTLANLEQLVESRFDRIHILGGGSQNQLLTRLTAEKTGIEVDRGHVESSTIGNFAVQLASPERNGERVTRQAILRWSRSLAGE